MKHFCVHVVTYDYDVAATKLRLRALVSCPQAKLCRALSRHPAASALIDPLACEGEFFCRKKMLCLGLRGCPPLPFCFWRCVFLVKKTKWKREREPPSGSPLLCFDKHPDSESLNLVEMWRNLSVEICRHQWHCTWEVVGFLLGSKLPYFLMHKPWS